jgi:hypothetical protein
MIKSSAYVRGYIAGILKQAQQNAVMRAPTSSPLSWLRGTWANRAAIQQSPNQPQYRNPLQAATHNLIVNPGHTPGSSHMGIGQFGGQGKRDQFLGAAAFVPATLLAAHSSALALGARGVPLIARTTANLARSQALNGTFGRTISKAVLGHARRKAIPRAFNGLATADLGANAYSAHKAFVANAARAGISTGAAYKSLLPAAAGMLPGQQSTPFDNAMRKSIAGNALYAMGGGTEGAIPALHTARMMATGPQQLANSSILQRWGDRLRNSGYSALAKTRLPDIQHSAVVNAYRKNPQALVNAARMALPPQLQARVGQIQAQFKPVQGQVQQLVQKYGPPYTQQGRMRKIVKNAPPASQGLSYTPTPQLSGNSIPTSVSAPLLRR